LRLCCLTVCGLLLSLLLCVLFGKVSTHNAATERTDHSMVASVVSGDPADDSTLQASCSVRRACHCEGKRRCHQAGSYQASVHSNTLRVSIDGM